MTSKIFRSTVFVAVLVLLCSLSVILGVLYSHFTDVQMQQLKDELSLAVTGTEQYGNAFLENVEADRFRVTWIDADGTVLYDTQADQTVMENHADREEIREFSANVSHELKMPLQGIIGSAELLESGMVKAADTSRFVGHIRREAKRLVNLVEDIIRLSQLDEGIAVPAETVDLLEIAEEVRAILEASTAEKEVRISVSGAGFHVTGVRSMLQEILYNLCDNAIKYNIIGGSVNICVEDRNLSVSDTGIGIPSEHKDRIFERFYRVDKSHSKATGGTGLGLSIVKHAAAYHNAKIALDSTPGKGTTMTIQF